MAHLTPIAYRIPLHRSHGIRTHVFSSRVIPRRRIAAFSSARFSPCLRAGACPARGVADPAISNRSARRLESALFPSVFAKSDVSNRRTMRLQSDAHWGGRVPFQNSNLFTRNLSFLFARFFPLANRGSLESVASLQPLAGHLAASNHHSPSSKLFEAASEGRLCFIIGHGAS
jgi:hypothetical protein